MFEFCFDAVGDPSFRLLSGRELYPIMRDHLYEHGQLIGPTPGRMRTGVAFIWVYG